MGLLFLFIAASFNMTKSYSSKLISTRVNGLSAAVDMTLCRNLLCALIGAVLIAINGADGFIMPPVGWLVCLLAGVAIGANYIVWILALKSSVYLFANAANTASFIVAALCGILFWNEKLSFFKALAIVLILTAMFFMGKYQKQSTGKIEPSHLLLLFLVFLSSGMSFVTQKQFTRSLPEASAHTYTFYSLLISVVLLLTMSFFVGKGIKIKERTKQLAPLAPWVILMAICFYSTTFFQTKASNLLDAVVMYPVYNGTLLVAGNLMAWFCFSEKPSKNSIIGVIFVFAAIVLSRM